MQSKPMIPVEISDELKLRNDKTIKGQLEPGEEVLFSCKVHKHNKRDVAQERVLMITNRYVYNLALADLVTQVLSLFRPTAVIKRKISLVSIAAITLSTYHSSDQFILHVSKEYDYRFSGVLKKREVILRLICKEFREATGKNMPFYLKPDADLANYQTTDDDFKAGKNKMPKDHSIILSDEDLQKGMDTIVKLYGDGKTKDDSNVSQSVNPFKKMNTFSEHSQQNANPGQQIDVTESTYVQYRSPSQPSPIQQQQNGYPGSYQANPTLNTFSNFDSKNTEATKPQETNFTYQATTQETENKGQVKLDFASSFKLDPKPEPKKEEFKDQPQLNVSLNSGLDKLQQPQSQPQSQPQPQPQPQYQSQPQPQYQPQPLLQSRPQPQPQYQQVQQVQPQVLTQFYPAQTQQSQFQPQPVYYQQQSTGYAQPQFINTTPTYNPQGITLANVNQANSVYVTKRF